MEGIFAIFSNLTLWVAVLSWAVAQLVKIGIELKKRRKVSLALVFSSGGMPSSHTSFVTAMATAIGLTDGFASTGFALAAVLSLVVMYDAAGVRRAAGKHAKALNKLFETLEDSNVSFDEKLKELLGHSPIEVAAGALLGVTVAAFLVR